MSSGDDRDERPKRSWSEIDKLRDKPRARRDERGGSPADTVRGRAAAQQYLRKLDRHLFAKGSRKEPVGGREGDAVRAALGTSALTEACRAYLEAQGTPSDATLLSAFLDTRDRELQLVVLRALAAGSNANGAALTPGLRAQLRTLAEGLDDELAEAAEAALAAH